jgi:hypothetical protein
MNVEPVYSVWNYYDGIQSGVAGYRGSPHYFERDWSEEKQADLSTFTLIPITDNELAEVVERERIFREWEAKFHQGKVDVDTHPGAEGQSSSFFELQRTFKARASQAPLRLSTPEFTVLPGQEERPKGLMARLQVAWHDED